MKVALTVIKGPERGRVEEFTAPRGYVIGRARNADLRLPENDPYVSRRHIFLEICPPGCRLQDIGTTNPAYVNGEPFTERELNDGDVIEVGYTQLKISITVHVTPYIWSCPACGRSLELLPGDPVPAQCPACAEAKRQVARVSRPVRPVYCSSCHTELTAQANSDGRAEELYGIVTYACERHVPQGDEHAGQVIADYEVRRLLGEGGMGVVYLVYHRPTARLLALKRIKNLRQSLLIKRFEREIRLLTALTHSNVVRLLATGIDDRGDPFLVTEYVPGGDLEGEVLRQGGKLPVPFAVGLIVNMLDGLEYLHAQSLIHRDIKPQNILLQRKDVTGSSSCIPKITDFGLAVSYARAGMPRLTKPGTALGTLMFMPPEQVQDASTVQAPADLYAVGVTLYYLLTGYYSFNFPTPGEIREFQQQLRQKRGIWKNPPEALRLLMQWRRITHHPFNIILSEQPIPIQQRDASLPRQLAAVVDKAVRKEARKRFQTAAELRSALQQAMR